jgi:hypothetical protein
LLPPYPRGAGNSSPEKARGTARRGARPILWHANLAARVAPLGAPSRRLCGAGPRFRSGLLACRRFRRPAEPGPISELLAAGRSARGRSPDAARKRAERRHARGRRPEPHEPAQPVRAPSRGSSGKECGPSRCWNQVLNLILFFTVTRSIFVP